MAKMIPELARATFTYDPETGILRWKVEPNRKVRVGAQAGTKMKTGYMRVMYQQKCYMVHCLAWAIVHGEWPSELDHRDRVRDNNRLDNLRLVTDRRLNGCNRGISKVNTSGAKGVSFHRQTGKWWARISVANRKRKSLGLFNTIEAAAEAYRRAEAIHHGEWGIYGETRDLGGLPIGHDGSA